MADAPSIPASDIVQIRADQLVKYIKSNQAYFYGFGIGAIIVSLLLVIVTSLGISIYNQCNVFRGEKPSGSYIFLIIVLVISILIFIGALAGVIVYAIYVNKNKLK